MGLKTLLDTPPWDWPTDAGRMFGRILLDPRSDESDRLVAAELAGDFTVINDDLADALLTVAGSAGEPEQLRAGAAISLGPVLEQDDTDGFEDPDDVPITEQTFRKLQDSLEKLYLDNSTPPRRSGGEFWKSAGTSHFSGGSSRYQIRSEVRFTEITCREALIPQRKENGETCSRTTGDRS